jgi:hypothetical protein
VFTRFGISDGLCLNARVDGCARRNARAASDPLKRPAIAAPAMTALDGLIIYQLSFYGFCLLFVMMVRGERDPSIGSFSTFCRCT